MLHVRAAAQEGAGHSDQTKAAWAAGTRENATGVAGGGGGPCGARLGLHTYRRAPPGAQRTAGQIAWGALCGGAGVLAPQGAPAGGGGAHPSRIVSGLWGADDVDKRLVTGMIAIRMLLQVMCTASSVGKSSQSVHSNMGSICSGVNFFFSAGLTVQAAPMLG